MRFLARDTGGKTTKGASVSVEHSAFSGSRQDQGVMGPPRAVVTSSEEETGPPHQGGSGP